MKSAFRSAATVLLLFSPLSVGAVTLYTATSQTAARLNPTNDGEVNAITFDNVFVATPGGENSIQLESINFGIRRGPTAGFLVPVDVTFYVAEMTGALGDELGSVTPIGSTSLLVTASNVFVTEVITQPLSLNMALNASQPGFGGFWIGMSFSGPNAASDRNGWRVVNAPTLGTSDSGSFAIMSDTTPFGLFALADPTPSNFYLEVSGILSVVPEPAVLGYIGMFAGILVMRRRR